ncbi:multiple sugar transport system substrate-binding protein [Evansella vedderi]|uniref:Multiple sugar transport system substrate-binding protein n=1 Tax=Evansella vedderi TaxID=38282 RepID=A0ABT9ZPH0_9BACI|nr:sugar ABC transporter substrate-binding protein [Evansella vedderi]MDQ0253141.1 multiple sugar transport system substrate-binding protein [Evansella vedderi]
MASKFRIFSIVCFVILLTAAIIGCSDSTSSGDANTNNNENTNSENAESDQANIDSVEEVELRFMWWGSQTRHDRMLKLIELYEEENPHVTINYEFLNFDDYAERLATQAAAGNAPDVFFIVDRWLPQYTDAGLLADLQPYIDSGAINTDHIEQSALDPGYIGDQLVGLNAGSNAFALGYNPEMFDEAGVPYPEPGYTWDDLVEMGRQVQDALGLKYGLVLDPQHDRTFGVWLRQHGQWLYNEDGTELGMEDDQLFIDFLNYKMNIVEEGIAPPADVAIASGNVENWLLVTGESPMQIFHSNQIVPAQAAANKEFAITSLPFHENGESGQYIRAGLFYAMNANTPHTDEVIKFMDFMTNSKEANGILQAEYGVPISAEIREFLYADAERGIQQTFEYIEMMSEIVSDPPPPMPPIGQEMNVFFQDVFYEVYYGLITPEEALEKYKNGLQDMIDR